MRKLQQQKIFSSVVATGECKDLNLPLSMFRLTNQVFISLFIIDCVVWFVVCLFVIMVAIKTRRKKQTNKNPITKQETEVPVPFSLFSCQTSRCVASSILRGSPGGDVPAPADLHWALLSGFQQPSAPSPIPHSQVSIALMHGKWPSNTKLLNIPNFTFVCVCVCVCVWNCDDLLLGTILCFYRHNRGQGTENWDVPGSNNYACQLLIKFLTGLI